MKTNQIYSLINAVESGMTGGAGITVTDTASFLSYGATTLAAGVENFYQSLADRIGRTIVLYEELTKKNLIERQSVLEFGAILQTIEVKSIADAEQNKSWEASTTAQNKQIAVNPFDVIKQDTTDLLTQYFSRRGAWEHDKLIWDYQLRDAFTNESAFGAFVEMIFQDMYNAMTLAENSLQHAALSTSIASAIHTKESKPKMARNLLHEYNTATNATLTVATALINRDFLAYAANEILLAVKKMRDPSTFYNELGATKWTDNASVKVLSDFSTALDTYLASNTYHDEMVRLPGYDELNFWQGQATDGTFESVSTVHIQVHDGDADDTGTEVNQSGVIATIYDPRRLGYMFDRVRTKSIYNPASECTAYFHKADKGMYLNRARNCVVFYLAEV